MTALLENILIRLRKIVLVEKPLFFLIGLALVSVVTFQIGRNPFRHFKGSGVKKEMPLLISRPQFIQDWRERFLKNSAVIDHEGLVRGIFLGEDRFISSEVSEDFRTAGLYHLLAASGFNCFIVSAVFLFAARFLFYLMCHRLPFHWIVRIKNHLSAFASISGAWLFFLLSDQSPPILRAAVMVTSKWAVSSLGIRTRFVRVLFAHFLFFLIFDPRLSRSASFLLTFGVLFGIIGADYFYRNHMKVRNWILAQVITNTGACIGALPVSIFVFGEANFTSVVTNFFAVPITSFILMPTALVSLMLSAPILSGYHLIESCGAYFMSISAWSGDVLLKILVNYLRYGIVLHYG